MIDNIKRVHSAETKKKIARGNTGKVFSEERRRNIGLSGQTEISDEILDQIKELWKEHCEHEQVKFMPRDMPTGEIEYLLELCKEEVPYKDIAEKLGRHHKQIRKIIIRLQPFYAIEPIPKPKGNHTQEHRNFLKNKMAAYNKENPKFGILNGNWRNGITSLRYQIYSIKEYKTWRINIFTRDGFKCNECFSNKNIEADHIYPFGLILHDANIETVEEAKTHDKLWDIENGRTLCNKCHRKTETYSMKLAQQIITFKGIQNDK